MGLLDFLKKVETATKTINPLAQLLESVKKIEVKPLSSRFDEAQKFPLGEGVAQAPGPRLSTKQQVLKKAEEVTPVIRKTGTEKLADLAAPFSLLGTQSQENVILVNQAENYLKKKNEGIEPTKEEKMAFQNVGLFTLPTVGELRAVEPAKESVNKYLQSLIKQQAEARKGPVSNYLTKAKDFYKEVKTKLVDFSAPIEDILRIAQKKGKFTILPEKDISPQIDRVLRAPTLAGQFARDKGLVDVIKKAPNLDALDQYLIAKQARTVGARGIETGRDLIKDAQLIKELSAEYEPFAKQVTKYSQDLLDYSVSRDIISEELATKLKKIYPDYVPLNRIFNELERAGGDFGSKAVASLSKQSVVQKITGSKREIESPIASLLAKTNDAFKQGEKNIAGKILSGYKDLPGNPFMLRELKAGEKAPYTISYLDKGIKRTFETTKEIADAAKALNAQQLNILGKIFALPVRIAKLGITGINLPFVGANVARDQVFAFINSKNALRTSVANPPVFLRSMLAAVGHDNLYKELVRAGAGGTSFDIARNQVVQTIGRIRGGRSVASKIKYTVKNPSELLRSVEDIIGRSEELTRLQQFTGTKQALLKKGVPEERATIQAATAARENTANFYRRGEWGHVLNSAFLYLNASIQGARSFIKALSRQPAQTAGKIATVLFTPVAIATLWNLNDPKRREAYLDIAEYEKDNNLIIIPPDPIKDDKGKWNVIKMPLPPGVGQLSIPIRRGVEQGYGLDPVKWTEVAKALISSISPIEPESGSIISTLTPQALKPSLEAITNTNFFTGLPQVSPSKEKLSPELQVKPYTSGAARIVGGKLDVSPIKVEEFVKGTFGGVGEQALNLVDRVLAGAKIIPEDQIGGKSIIEGIAGRFTKARGGEADKASEEALQNIIRQQADESFRLKQEAELVYQELKALPKDEANAKFKEIKAKNPSLADKIKTVKEDAELGLSYNDRLIKQLGVKNGERAMFIWEAVNALPSKEEKNAYVNELKEKKIISDTVFEQLQKLKKGESITKKTTAQDEVPSGVVIHKLPDYLGGGEFATIKATGEPFEFERDIDEGTKRRLREGSFADTEKEVDHKISIALGGTNAEENLQALKSDKTLLQTIADIFTGKERTPGEFKNELRQEGKMVVEWVAIDKYRKGEISLAEARAAIINWDNRPEVFLREANKKAVLKRFEEIESTGGVVSS